MRHDYHRVRRHVRYGAGFECREALHEGRCQEPVLDQCVRFFWHDVSTSHSTYLSMIRLEVMHDDWAALVSNANARETAGEREKKSKRDDSNALVGETDLLTFIAQSAS